MEPLQRISLERLQTGVLVLRNRGVRSQAVAQRNVYHRGSWDYGTGL